MIEKNRREKLMAYIKQAEKVIEEVETDDTDFLTAIQIFSTVCSDVTEVCRVSEASQEMLTDKLERIRRSYETG